MRMRAPNRNTVRVDPPCDIPPFLQEPGTGRQQQRDEEGDDQVQHDRPEHPDAQDEGCVQIHQSDDDGDRHHDRRERDPPPLRRSRQLGPPRVAVLRGHSEAQLGRWRYRKGGYSGAGRGSMKPMDYVDPEGPRVLTAGNRSPSVEGPMALPSHSQDSPDSAQSDSPPRQRRHWMPRSVRITLMI